MRSLQQDIVPTIVSENRRLMNETSRDRAVRQRMNEAQAIVKSRNYDEAIRQYDLIANEHGSVAARNNAELLRLAVSSASAARARMDELYTDTGGVAGRAVSNAYQLCDGFAVSNGYYVIYPNVGGIFKGIHDTADDGKHPVTFRFRTLSALRSIAEKIAIHIEGLADTDGYIDEFICTEGKIEHTNSLYIPGRLFTIYGHKIKVEGDESVTGMFLVDIEDPSKCVKLDDINQNDPSAIRGLIPDTGDLGSCRLEIRTHYSGTTGRPLKDIRIITSPFILERG